MQGAVDDDLPDARQGQVAAGTGRDAGDRCLMPHNPAMAWTVGSRSSTVTNAMGSYLT